MVNDELTTTSGRRIDLSVQNVIGPIESDFAYSLVYFSTANFLFARTISRASCSAKQYDFF